MIGQPVGQQQHCCFCTCVLLHLSADGQSLVCFDVSGAGIMQGSDLGCCQAAAHLVWYISRSDTLRVHLQQQPHLLPVLLDLLVNQDAASARAAAFTLNNLAVDPACR